MIVHPETEAGRRDAEVEGLAAELLARYEEITLLYRLSGQLAGTLDVAELCERALANAMRVIECGDAEIAVRDGDLLRIEASSGALAWLAGQLVPVGSGITGIAAATGAPIVLDPEDETPAGTTTPRSAGEPVLSVPLRLEPAEEDAPGETIGALTLLRTGGGERFTAGDVQLAQAIAGQLASRIQTSRLADELREAERAHRELELAAAVQRSLLPELPPALGGLRLAARNVPAAQIGGDLFDVVLDDRGRLWTLVADVAGHGVGSALMMAMVRAVVRLQLHARESPAAALAAANDALYTDLVRSELLVTAFCARYDRATGRLAFANAAQNPPLLRRLDGSVEALDTDGTPLGLIAAVPYEEGEVELAPGELLLLHTDGAEEARDADGELFGNARLRSVVAAAADPDGLVDAVLAAVVVHGGSQPRADDVTLLAVSPA